MHDKYRDKEHANQLSPGMDYPDAVEIMATHYLKQVFDDASANGRAILDEHLDLGELTTSICADIRYEAKQIVYVHLDHVVRAMKVLETEAKTERMENEWRPRND